MPQRAVWRVDHDRILVERWAAMGREDGVGIVIVDPEPARAQAGEGIVGKVTVARDDTYPRGIREVRRPLARDDRV